MFVITRASKINKLSLTLLIFITTLVCIGLLTRHILLQPGINKIYLDINGDTGIQDRLQIKQILTNYYKKNFFTTDIRLLQHKLESIDWVKSARIIRKENKELEVIIHTHDIVAFWHHAHNLLTATGVILKNNNFAYKELPILKGKQEDIVSILLSYKLIINSLLQIGIKTYSIHFHQGNWRILSKSGLSIDVEDTKLTAKISRFVRIYPLMSNKDHIASINLNYTDGLSVEWLKKQ